MPRRVCLATGVSNVTPRPGEESRFVYLDGAPLAAEAIGQWALRSGFGGDNVRIIELLTFGIKRISLISDACRDAPKDLNLMRLDSRRAIMGRRAQSDSPMFDRLAACQD